MPGEGYIGESAGLVASTQRNDLKVRYGTHTTVAASDTVDTGLTTVLSCSATLGSDASLATLWVTAAPSSGNIVIKSWKPTAVDNCTPTAATAWSKTVYWVAVGY